MKLSLTILVVCFTTCPGFFETSSHKKKKKKKRTGAENQAVRRQMGGGGKTETYRPPRFDSGRITSS